MIIYLMIEDIGAGQHNRTAPYEEMAYRGIKKP